MNSLTAAVCALASVFALSTGSAAQSLPRAGDWVSYAVISASESIPTCVSRITLTIGDTARVSGVDVVWWQMSVDDAEDRRFDIQALSERAPMTTPSGDIGAVFRYVFRQAGRPALEYTDSRSKPAFLPRFGFREGLIPVPRSARALYGPFMAAGNYLGQALGAADSGASGKWLDLGPVTVLELDHDLVIGTSRMFRDDGSGQDENRQYNYVEFDPSDYREMLDAGFNLFTVNGRHIEHVRESPVFFIIPSFSKSDPYPELLYRSNYWGPCMFTDEPAVRLDTSQCSTVYEAANLLRLRNFTYHRAPQAGGRAARPTQQNAVMNMIQQSGFSTGDWLPLQTHVGVWETVYQSAFYQMQGGAAFVVHEGRYNLRAFNDMLQNVLGPGAVCDARQMYDLVFCFMRGAARCFGGDWGIAIYGQADYAIAPDAVRQAYDQGAKYIWWWTSDHDHHLPFDRQLELTRIIRAHQRANPRDIGAPQLTRARAAVAVPEGCICSEGSNMWGSSAFRFDKLNEFGARYGDINAEIWWQLYRLVKQGISVDCVVDVPEIINRAGYDRIIRVGADGSADLPAPRMPVRAPTVTIGRDASPLRCSPRPGAPRAAAVKADPDAIEIDGSLEDWAHAHWIDLRERQMYDAAGHAWNGDADLSARAAFAYDQDSLYIAAQVTDDVMTAECRGDLIWQNDSLQVALDPFFNRHPEGDYAPDDIEIGFSLVDGRPYAHRWDARPVGAPGELVGAQVAISRTGEVTVYEARVPFESLWPLSPAFPGECGMTVVVNDADGGLRRGATAWTSGLADIKNPSVFGVLEFPGAESVRDPAPVVFAQAERAVVSAGEPLVLLVDAGSREAAELDLEIILRHRQAEAPASRMRFSVPAGLNRFRAAVDTTGLQPSSYLAEIAPRSAGGPGVRQGIRVYVLPPEHAAD